jgi:hypothetical protein
MTVITKKDEKISATASALKESFSPEEFVEKFKELHPKDWEKIEKNYRKHERDTKPGKSHPMPEPSQYIKNALNVWARTQQ